MKRFCGIALAFMAALSLSAFESGAPMKTEVKTEIASADVGRGDLIDPDQAATVDEAFLWQNVFKGQDSNEAYSVSISEFTGDSFWFEILKTADGSIVYAGRAVLNPDGSYGFVFDDGISFTFKLNSETAAIELSAGDDSLSGVYGETYPNVEAGSWNGLDFGRNVSYTEEYVFQSGLGDNIIAAEGAKVAFNYAKAKWVIPDYSDEIEYTMTLVDLRDANGEECYIYRVDADVSGGENLEVLAYAYLSGSIYAEGVSGEWIRITTDWSGINFGPNLTYAEEYVIQGDPGEYPNVAECAKITFDFAKGNGNIPDGYSTELEYTMTLVDLMDINGEECHVYRLDVNEPTGTVGAAYAYSYQTGNIYMQGQGSEWVKIAPVWHTDAEGRTYCLNYSAYNGVYERSIQSSINDINEQEFTFEYLGGNELSFKGSALRAKNEESALELGPNVGEVSGTAVLNPDGTAGASFENENGTLEFSFYEDGTLTVTENGVFGGAGVSFNSGDVKYQKTSPLKFSDVIDFSAIQSLDFWHGSGAGAWSTELTLYPDGSFEGLYHDSEMGSSGEGYPGGTVYHCLFSGQFSPLKKLGGNEYSLTVDSLILEEEPDKEEILDGVKYISSDPVGIDEADEFLFYLPDKRIDELSEDFLSGVWMALNEESETLGFVSLFNVTGVSSFMGNKAEELLAEPDGVATLYADFGNGGDVPMTNEYEIGYNGELTPETLLTGLTELTGLDFFADIVRTQMGIVVDWKADSTLIADLDDREQKEGFFMYDTDSLRWFMMDSLYLTLLNNFGEENIFYTMDGGKELAFDELYPINVFPSGIPYMGGDFYFAHADGRGQIYDENEATVYLQEKLAELGMVTEGTTLILDTDGGDAWFGEMAVWYFDYGTGTAEKFTGEKRFAVTYDWEIWEYDAAVNEWTVLEQ